MSHVAEGSLQALIDGELEGAARAAAIEHLSACAACESELATLREADRTVHGALGLLDVTPPLLRARAAVAAQRTGRRRPVRLARLGAGGLARAAMLLLALAGVGAAAIPDSPVRRALEATISRVAGLFDGADPAPVRTAPAPAPADVRELESSSIAIAPANGRVRVQLAQPTGPVDVIVRLTDGARARVQTSTEQGGVRFVSAMGRLEVLGLSAGEVVIELPRTVSRSDVQVGEAVHAVKQGDELRLVGPAGEGQGTEVRFRIGY